jgi:hypothetical protein
LPDVEVLGGAEILQVFVVVPHNEWMMNGHQNYEIIHEIM